MTSVPSPSASPSPTTNQQTTTVAVVASRGPRAGSKWGRLLGSSSVDSGSDGSAKVNVSRSLSARESLRESAQGRTTGAQSNNGQGNKVKFAFNSKSHLSNK